MKIFQKTILLASIWAFSTAVSANNAKISATDFGDDWPFTVNEGTLHCQNGAVGFNAEGVMYALNGLATSAGLSPVEPVWKFNMKIIEEMAKALDLTIEEAKAQAPIRMDIGTVLSAGLKLCES